MVHKRVIMGLLMTSLLLHSASSALAQNGGVQVGTATTQTSVGQTDSEIDPAAFAPCDQEMTTCPCNGVRVEKDVVKSGDVLMLRLKETPVVSFPLRVE